MWTQDFTRFGFRLYVWLISCVTLAKSCNLSKPCFLHLCNGDNNNVVKTKSSGIYKVLGTVAKEWEMLAIVTIIICKGGDWNMRQTDSGDLHPGGWIQGHRWEVRNSSLSEIPRSPTTSQRNDVVRQTSDQPEPRPQFSQSQSCRGETSGWTWMQVCGENTVWPTT